MAWDQNYATQWGQAQGFLKPGEIATGGLLDSRVAAAGKNDMYNAAKTAANNSTGAPGIKPLTTASMNDYQKTALGTMGQPPKPVDGRVGQSYDRAFTAAGNAGKAFDSGSYKQFMNPYIDEVINRNAGTIRRSFDTQRNATDEAFARSGGFGSTAQGVEKSLTNEAESRQIGDMDAALRQQGWNDSIANALGLYRTDTANALAQGSQFLNIGNAYQGLDEYGRNIDYTGQDRQLAAGDRVQGQNQRELDAYYAERDRLAGYPYQQSQFLQGIINPYLGTNSSSTQPGVGMIPGAIGGGLIGSKVGDYLNTSSNFVKNPQVNYSGVASGSLPWLNF